MKTHQLVAMFAVMALAATLTADGATVRKSDREGLWRVESDAIRFDVDAARGARIASLVFKPVGKESVYDGGGFCLDHFWEQSWPGEFLDAPYTVAVAQPAPGTVVVTATRISTGRWADAPPAPMSNLVLTRRMTLEDGKPWITVDIAIANTNTATKMFGFWAQQCFNPAAVQQGVTYFRPGDVGIAAEQETSAYRHTPGPPEVCYVKHPVAGWTATVDSQAQTGFVFLMDYGDMSWLYNCVGMSTTEWMYERAVLPPGKTWRTQYVIRPFAGLTSVAHAGSNSIVALAPAEKPDALDVKFSLLRSTADVTGGTLKVEIVNLITGAKFAAPDFRFDALTEQPIEHTVTRPGPLLQQVVVRAELSFTRADGSTAQEKFEYFYGGRLDFSGKNLRLDMTPIYIIPSPPRQRRYLKPDLIALVPHDGFNVVWVQGMFYDRYGIDGALRRIPGASAIESVPYGGLLSEGLKDFPMSYDEMLRQDVVVLADAAATAFDDATAERLKDFVEAGGGLLVFGGPWSLGKGGYRGTKVGKLLPVETVGAGDFRLAPAALRLEKRDSVLAGLPWAEQPRCYVIQEVKPRDGVEIWLRCGDYPAMIAGKVGKGRVAVVSLVPMGDPGANEMPWWNWPHWPEALAKCLQWLAGKETL